MRVLRSKTDSESTGWVLMELSDGVRPFGTLGRFSACRSGWLEQERDTQRDR